MFASNGPIHKNRLPSGSVSRRDVKSSLFEFAGVEVYAVPSYHVLLGCGEEACLGLVVWGVPIP